MSGRRRKQQEESHDQRRKEGIAKHSNSVKYISGLKKRE